MKGFISEFFIFITVITVERIIKMVIYNHDNLLTKLSNTVDDKIKYIHENKINA